MSITDLIFVLQSLLDENWDSHAHLLICLTSVLHQEPQLKLFTLQHEQQVIDKNFDWYLKNKPIPN